MTQSPLYASLHWITTGNRAPFGFSGPSTHAYLCVCPNVLVPVLRGHADHHSFQGDNSTNLISQQQLWLPYLSGCHIIVPPFSTAPEAFVVAVFWPAYVPLCMAVEHLEKSWLKIACCVTCWVFHNSLHRLGIQLFSHYTHTHTHTH